MNLRSTLLVLSLTVFGLSAMAQLTTDNTITPEEAVEVLLGNGVSAFNITFSGDPDQVGSFDCVNCGLGIDDGMILATGNVEVAEGPNNSGSQTLGGGNFGSSDPDLAIANPNFALNDAAILEFDFLAGGDSVEFRYVWASEEYPEFVNSSFNDAFAFFLSGPGISGGQGYSNDAMNIALVPGTTLPVTIDNVNIGLNSQYYVSNPSQPNSIQFDGYTTVLTALMGNLQCGETYHIKLVLADAGDTAYDSAVFIEADSFTSNALLIEGTASVDTPIFLGDTVVVEGCNTAAFELTRPNGSMEEVITIQVLGTAGNGTDYQPMIPTEVTFLEGETTLTIPFTAIEDGLTEDPEEIILAYTFVNACGEEQTISASVYIVDYVMPEVGADDVVSPCPGYPVDVSAFPVEGYSPFTYVWSNEDVGQVITVSPMEETTYTVVATDICGTETSTDVTVTVSNDPPPLVLAEIPDLNLNCPGNFASLQVVVESGTPQYGYNWSNGGVNEFITVFPMETTTYTVTVTDACLQEATAEVTVNIPDADPFEVEVTVTGTQDCPGDPLTLTANPSGGYGNYTYNWQFQSFQQTYTVSPTADGTYTVNVSDICGQQVTGSIFIDVPDAGNISITIEEEGDVLCPGDPVTLTGSASGGFGTLSYQWNGSASANGVLDVNPQSTTTYTFSATDGCNITATQTVTVDVPVYPSISINTTGGNAYCLGDPVSISANATGGLAPLSYTWDTGASGQATTVNPNDPNGVSYVVTVEDACGTVASANAVVTVSQFSPISLTLDTLIYCAGNSGEITQIFGGADPYDYQDFYSEPEGFTFFADSSFTTSYDAGLYEIVVVDACGNEGSIEVVLLACETVIPNIITPNGDEINDEFIILNIENFPGSQLKIYNRWGNLVYESNDYKNSAAFNGEGVSDGTYFYTLVRADGEEFSGNLTITR